MFARTISRVTRFVDLSAPIAPSPAELPPFLRTDVEFFSHADGAAEIDGLFGVPPRLLRDGEGWTRETITNLGTHNSTHVDAPYHYNSTIRGEPAQTIDELPLEWFFAPGVVLDFTGREDGDAVRADELEPALAARRPRAARARHRADADGLRPLLRRAGLHVPRPRRHRRGDGVAVRPRSESDGHRRVGLGPPAATCKPRKPWNATSRESSGPPTRRTCRTRRSSGCSTWRRYRRRGFTVACFPLKLVGASAAPARVVAIVG